MILEATAAVTVAVATDIPDVWADLADCESGQWDRDGQPIDGTARWDITEGLHEGGLQFAPSTWDGFAPDHFPDAAYQATPVEQVAVARRVLEVQGWQAWPTCARKVGAR